MVDSLAESGVDVDTDLVTRGKAEFTVTIVEDKAAIPEPIYRDSIFQELWKRVNGLKCNAAAWNARESTGGGRDAVIAYANVLIEMARLGGWESEKGEDTK